MYPTVPEKGKIHSDIEEDAKGSAKEFIMLVIIYTETVGLILAFVALIIMTAYKGCL